jgi:N-acetylglucosaminyldiphosphoundecaprenol N-acetyl-beta-D-mannosaminyltransferase
VASKFHSLPQYPVLGTTVVAAGKSDVATVASAWALRKDLAYGVSAADVHVISRARTEPDFRAAMEQFHLVCPDGMPLIWALNRHLPPDQKMTVRTSGAEIFGELLEHSNENPQLKHFLLGGSEKLLADLGMVIRQRYPKAQISGIYSPPFGTWPEDEFERICQKIRESGANLVWVGLGCPKQERWIGLNLANLPPAVYFAVGAAFAFHAGHVDRAPAWIQRSGLEWLYRIVKEPRRLWKRYFVYNSRYIYYTAKERLFPPS